MTEFGYKLCSEEQTPRELVECARRAEQVGFSFAMISDHFHPWVDKQGQSGFVWAVIGGVATATERLKLGTGVTCPTVRIHPAIIAQAAATCEAMMPGRFWLGVGSGEALNEHILGHRWPPADTRQQMLEEAVEVIRALWKGENTDHHGRYYTVENARIYTLPDQPPPVLVAASGSKAAELAGRIGDGLVMTGPSPESMQAFDRAGGKGKPRMAELTVCWAKSEAEAKKTALEYWPNAGLSGGLSQELPTPEHFEGAAKLVTEDKLAEEIICGPDAERHVEKAKEYVKAGFTHVWFHQVGPDQEGFFRFYEREVLPKLR
jgi:coenzyme F420-dependent glucose-6-phosphate dehydrogenase